MDEIRFLPPGLPLPPEPEAAAEATSPVPANRLPPGLPALEQLDLLYLDDSCAWSLSLDDQPHPLYSAPPAASRNSEAFNSHRDSLPAEPAALPWSPIDPGNAAAQYALYASLTMPMWAQMRRVRLTRRQRKHRPAPPSPEPEPSPPQTGDK